MQGAQCAVQKREAARGLAAKLLGASKHITTSDPWAPGPHLAASWTQLRKEEVQMVPAGTLCEMQLRDRCSEDTLLPEIIIVVGFTDA